MLYQMSEMHVGIKISKFNIISKILKLKAWYRKLKFIIHKTSSVSDKLILRAT